MRNQIKTRSQSCGHPWLDALLATALCFVAACDEQQEMTQTASARSDAPASEARQQAAPAEADTPAAEEPAKDDGSSAPVPSPVAPSDPHDLSSVDVQPAVKGMLSDDLFKLTPKQVPRYFAKIATLTPTSGGQTWQRSFAGSSKLTWGAKTLVELSQDEGETSFRLGRAVVAWVPPMGQERAFYDRVVAAMQKVRNSEPTFTRSGKEYLMTGWTWCANSCEAEVELTATPRIVGLDLPLESGQSAVVLTAYVPAGP